MILKCRGVICNIMKIEMGRSFVEGVEEKKKS
jgi:hypothetical protein